LAIFTLTEPVGLKARPLWVILLKFEQVHGKGISEMKLPFLAELFD